jgi:thiamine transport system ATP-binding protein
MDMIRISNGIYNWQGFHLAMDFAVAENTVTAVLGPSGAGKSTLLNIIAGFEKLASGRIMLQSVDHTKTQPAARPASFVFQDNNTFAHMSARNNVALGISPSLRLNTSQWTSVDEALTKVGIVDLASRKPGEMSGGERQRIALARVLVRQRPILLLDEAFAALGPSLRIEMLQLVKSLQSEKRLTVLMVTHQPEDAKAIADHVMFVSDGIVQQPVGVQHFFKSQDAAIQNYLR